MDFNNPVSISYSKKSIESFKCVEDLIEIIPTQCVVPKDLKWIDKVDQFGVGPTLDESVIGIELVYWPHHVLKSGNRNWSDPEKCCFASHVKLWLQQIKSSRFIILEHDAYLINEAKFRKDFERMDEFDLWMPGIAVECYSLSLNFSRYLVTMKMIDQNWNTISCGPMGHLVKISKQWNTLIPKDGRKNLLNDDTKSPVTQIYSKSLGITLDHKLDTKYEDMPNLFVIE